MYSYLEAIKNFTHPLIHPLNHPFTYPLIQSPTNLLIHPLIQTLTQKPIHLSDVFQILEMCEYLRKSGCEKWVWPLVVKINGCVKNSVVLRCSLTFNVRGNAVPPTKIVGEQPTIEPHVDYCLIILDGIGFHPTIHASTRPPIHYLFWMVLEMHGIVDQLQNCAAQITLGSNNQC